MSSMLLSSAGVAIPRTGDEKRAEQGARANDHGCHASCSEQHESRQPRSWLILNVGRNMKLKRGAKISVSCAGRPFAGPFKWTLVREWVALGLVERDDQ